MDDLREIVEKYWGYDTFRPLQAEAMRSVLDGRDSVVVMPTGGGKSLCYQAPALAMPGLAIVVSPLISLMKDQVDALVDNGVPAACVNSTQTPAERRATADEIRAGRLKLLYLSPEKLMTERTLEFLKASNVSFIAIDEAHCISDWGHDFRPEYRTLRSLKKHFPGIAVHGYTATATEHVRYDIVRELDLTEPEMLLGSFDRPNLSYRVRRRVERRDQILEVLARYRDRSGIIYCIRRKDVDEITAMVCDAGYSAKAYHAGLSDQERTANQDAFLRDRCKIIVATVAFGMGIDKSDVRFVVHAGAPKALENYQQESGRAGRDGLEAECVLLYSPQDFKTWRLIQSDLEAEAAENANRVLAGMERFCAGMTCRRRAILEYFGEEYPQESCQNCDVCLAELETIDEPLIPAQKILSCVIRLQEQFGGEYTALVLVGSEDKRILERGHDRLTTYGLMKEFPKKQVRDWIEQLVAQGMLAKTGEYDVLRVTPLGRDVLRGEATPRLLKPTAAPAKSAKGADISLEGVDTALFEKLRTWRKELADAKGVPSFVIFNDATLRDLARQRPSRVERLLTIQGIGDKKLIEYGVALVDLINAHCGEANAPADVAPTSTAAPKRKPTSAKPTPGGTKDQTWRLLDEKHSLEEIIRATGRSSSTIHDYLGEYIEARGIDDPSPWLEDEVHERIREAIRNVGMVRLKPIYEELNGEIGYEKIRIVTACMKNDPTLEQAADA
ncbi:MAG: DNA helicase RecQ [Pirellulales bacterium]